MNKVDFKPHFPFYNPYKDIREQSCGKPSTFVEKKPLSQIVDKIAENLIYPDLEKKVDFIGNAASILDWGVFGTVVVMEGLTTLERWLHLSKLTPITNLVAKAALPVSGLFLGVGIIEGVVELANFIQAQRLFERLQKGEKNPLQKLEWMKKHYFTLRSIEGQKIEDFIEEYCPTLAKTQKAEKYDRIASKILKNRFEAFERRVTPKLAYEIGNQMKTILENPLTPETQTHVEDLIDNMAKQAELKMIIHWIGMTAITMTVLSMLGVLIGITTPFFIVPLSVMTIGLIAFRTLLQYGIFNKEVENLYKKLVEFTPQVVVEKEHAPLIQEAL